MSEWYENQRKSSSKVADLLGVKQKERKRRTLTKEQKTRLNKLEEMPET